MLLAGDIGATKATLAVFSEERGPRNPLAKRTYPTNRFAGFNVIIHQFLEEAGLEVEHASFGVAGPVMEDRVEITNLPWAVDARGLEESLDLSSVRLLNDLASTANGLPLLKPAELHTLKQGEPNPDGARAVIAPGTGLGEAFLTWDGERYEPHSSEGSHVDFAPRTPRQMQLLRYLWPRFEHVSYELVCSGIGIPNVYEYYKRGGYAQEPRWLADALAVTDDPTPVIINAALDETRPCELCLLTLETFVSILGAEAGNLALKVLATGGVYLGGGIPPRILPALEGEHFLRAFLDKGRLAPLVERIPVHVILEPEVALMGAARYGLER